MYTLSLLLQACAAGSFVRSFVRSFVNKVLGNAFQQRNKVEIVITAMVGSTSCPSNLSNSADGSTDERRTDPDCRSGTVVNVIQACKRDQLSVPSLRNSKRPRRETKTSDEAKTENRERAKEWLVSCPAPVVTILKPAVVPLSMRSIRNYRRFSQPAAVLRPRCLSATPTTANNNESHRRKNNESSSSSGDNNYGRRFWKQTASGRLQRPIFVAATKQHVGKTTSSLALMSGLQKRYNKVGFIKPVGQQHVKVKSSNQNADIRVDKDVCLVREHFHLHHIDYEHMSPVIIPSGYTKKYVDGEISLESQIRDVERSMAHVSAASDVVLCEGTGHCAVGSIVGLNNAKVASLIGGKLSTFLRDDGIQQASQSDTCMSCPIFF